MSATRIRLSKISKAYGEQSVLANLDFAVDPGEFVAIIGRSGSGKSTLLRIAGALEQPDSGSVTHNDHDITTLTEPELATFRRSELGFVFQSFNLIDTLSASENIALPLVLNATGAAATRERVSELLRTLDIVDCGPRYPDELSGGEQQRVAIARAVAHRPGVVIADEPTGSLDFDTAAEVLALMNKLCRNAETTLLIATHSDEAIDAADRVLQLVDGRPIPA